MTDFHQKIRDYFTEKHNSLHCLQIQQQIQYKLGVLLLCLEVSTLPQVPHLGARTSGQKPFHSVLCLLVPPVKFTTVGKQASTVASPRIWNALRDDITSADSTVNLSSCTETSLFNHSLTLFSNTCAHYCDVYTSVVDLPVALTPL